MRNVTFSLLLLNFFHPLYEARLEKKTNQNEGQSQSVLNKPVFGYITLVWL